MWTIGRYAVPALAIAAFFSHLRFGTGTAGFSSGN
jgi:hypothetical protein